MPYAPEWVRSGLSFWVFSTLWAWVLTIYKTLVSKSKVFPKKRSENRQNHEKYYKKRGFADWNLSESVSGKGLHHWNGVSGVHLFVPQNRATGFCHPVHQLCSGKIVHRIKIIKALSGVVPEWRGVSRKTDQYHFGWSGICVSAENNENCGWF